MKHQSLKNQGYEAVLSAVIAAGGVLKDTFRTRNFTKGIKGERDFVLDADTRSEKTIMNAIKAHFSDCAIFAEESGIHEGENELMWAIDPLDGTNNFAFGLPIYGVAAGLIKKNKFEKGIIHIPELDSTVAGECGKGAFLNGTRIAVSERKKLADAIVHYDNQFHLSRDSAQHILKVWPKVFTMRITGSAVYDLSLVATGRADARIFHHTKLVDFAAAVPIIEEAGGRVTDFEGRQITKESTAVVFSNGFIHDELLNALH